ncbi:leucyl/phenylalanyl-tRNA--protein transferase [Oleiphilus sp. HI0068]|uniref:leucyl/phenylalanyl-tRNA--protein transferase n=1 Tax=Oleiphilus sp. HI0061 TaxID=1822239 RepID=UPI0007CF1F1B|nr:leucyl/phenylalanyl-tRNA--protein transferase [Oleiphilus sp. HI0061]KZY66859.1 leucyl/phenylalanyl-tRNA--protein transferase [Oleiphilus sp. HI0061]KZY72913.1 leucyl/phenylalanyl-tRNA--protein transferase [Oleiphilus sp. HI0068]KZY75618.1 leucyl/phenylalanyl-tRNA--protein transferase [Oleiphilus sp. HI0069]
MANFPWLDANDDFPPIEQALRDPDGLLAAGGDLSPERLIHAYSRGIFPWFSDDQPILWWSPDPRCVVIPDEVHISKSLKKHIRQKQPRLSFDQAFPEVIRHCARLDSEEGTWITEEMEEAYYALHELGVAHSVEVWENEELVGGLYGLAIGCCFFGESMFSLKPNASKVAFACLSQQLHKWGYAIIDCQVENPHLLTLGAKCIDRSDFLSILNKNIKRSPLHSEWAFANQGNG